MAKTQNSLIQKISIIALVFIIALSCVLFSGCTPTEEGISLQTSFKTAYVAGSTITFNGSEVSNMPDLTGGQLKYVYLENNQYNSRIIDLQQAALNYANSPADTTLDRVRIENFSTGKTANTHEMTLTLLPKNGTSGYAINVKYKIYENSEAIAGAENTTKILYKINDVLQFVLVPICSVVLTLGVIFVIVLVFNMARANNADQRAEAKKRIIYTVVGIAVAVALIIIFQLFSQNSIVWFGEGDFFTLGK